MPLVVPFWLAIALYKRKSCRIIPPDWLAVDSLQGLVLHRSCSLTSPSIAMHSSDARMILSDDSRQSLVSAAEVLHREKSTAAVFQPVPFHYLEIAKVLFAEAKACFGGDLVKVQSISIRAMAASHLLACQLELAPCDIASELVMQVHSICPHPA